MLPDDPTVDFGKVFQVKLAILKHLPEAKDLRWEQPEKLSIPLSDLKKQIPNPECVDRLPFTFAWSMVECVDHARNDSRSWNPTKETERAKRIVKKHRELLREFSALNPIARELLEALPLRQGVPKEVEVSEELYKFCDDVRRYCPHGYVATMAAVGELIAQFEPLLQQIAQRGILSKVRTDSVNVVSLARQIWSEIRNDWPNYVIDGSGAPAERFLADLFAALELSASPQAAMVGYRNRQTAEGERS